MKFEQIKEKIKKGNQYFLFNLNPDIPYLLAQGTTKTLIKNKLKKKVIKNQEKYKDTLCILMFFEFRVPDNRFTFGDLLVNVHRYKITENLKLKGEPKPFGYVFFTETYLEKNGLSYTYLRNIIYLYKLRKITFFTLGQPRYSGLVTETRHALIHYKKLKKN